MIDSATLREWARAHGIQVPSRGRLPASTRVRYEQWREGALNRERSGEFTRWELLIIEEVSGVPSRGRFWGGYGGEPVTDYERRTTPVHSRPPAGTKGRYMPPPTRTLQEAIDLVKAQAKRQ